MRPLTLSLPQDRNDLLFRKPASLHLSVLQTRAGLYLNRWDFPVADRLVEGLGASATVSPKIVPVVDFVTSSAEFAAGQRRVSRFGWLMLAFPG
jgi:hypothetical protein